MNSQEMEKSHQQGFKNSRKFDFVIVVKHQTECTPRATSNSIQRMVLNICLNIYFVISKRIENKVQDQAMRINHLEG